MNLTKRGWYFMPFEELQVFRHITELGMPLNKFSISERAKKAHYLRVETVAHKDIINCDFLQKGKGKQQ